jgi:hypothetical protein
MEWKMPPTSPGPWSAAILRRTLFLVLPALLSLLTEPTFAQQPEVVFRSASSLVLVDVVALQNGLPVKTLERDNFQLFDNGSRVSIKTFDMGAESTTRPLALWLVVQCKMADWVQQGSGLFAGEMHLFIPALKQIDQRDAVGVAHWCDNGDSQLDLQPTHNLEDVPAAIEQVLAATPPPGNHNRVGELALQHTLQLIVESTRSAKPEPLPVVIFLYGDWSGMPKSEANHFIDELLETSAISFGIKDSRSPHMWFLPGEQKEVAHYIAAETGGQYLEATPETYASALEQIIQQLHFRYELGFQPPALDGKRHKLRVEITGARHSTIRLRYRAAYVPLPPKSQ